MTQKKKRLSSNKTKPKSKIKKQTRTTKKPRKSADEQKLEEFIKEYLFRNAEQALSSEITENIEIQTVADAKTATLEELESLVEDKTARIIKELKQNGISKPADAVEQPDTVVEICDKIQARMEKNAKKLSKK